MLAPRATNPNKSKNSRRNWPRAKQRTATLVRLLLFIDVSFLKMRPSANLKKQAAQQAAEFDRLASKYNEATGAVSDKKSD